MTPTSSAPEKPAKTETSLVAAEDVSVVFRERSLFGRSTGFRALTDVDLVVEPGEIVGLVGESGSGKTTLGRAILGLLPIESGTIQVGDVTLTPDSSSPPASFRRRVQAVFQDPLQALNPRHDIETIVGEPLRIHEQLAADARRERVVELLEQVGLGEEQLDHRTRELSGGQRQRVAIARALAPDPDLLVLDEAVSALDVTTTAQVLRLLQEIRRPDTGALFIAHDLALVRGLCDRVAVMYRGRIVEWGTADEVCGRPEHPYTCLLVSSIPYPHPVVQDERRDRRLDGREHGRADVTPEGCPFAARCPEVDERCDVFPDPVTTGERVVSCHAVSDRVG